MRNKLNDVTQFDPDSTYRLNSVAVHLALLKTGQIIAFSGDHENIWNWTKGESSLWDPNSTNNLDAINNPVPKSNLFCSGHCFLPDGRLFVAGGQSTYNHPITILASIPSILQLALKILGKEAADHHIHTFNPELESDILNMDDDKRWKRHPQKMPKARWYPTCVTLPDGKALIVSGTSSHAHHSLFGGFMNTDYEIFDPITNKLSTPKKFGFDEIKMYPFLQVLPSNTLFVHSEYTTKFWNITKKEFIPNAKFLTNSHGTRTYPGMGSCVLLPLELDSDTAKILVVGGSMLTSPGKHTDATNLVESFTVDLKNPANSPGWKKEAIRPPRFLCDSILLPDGTVLVTNGAAKGTSDNNQVAVREVELFDPSDGSWKVIAYLKRDRLYHSSAILLQSGHVAVAGSTGHNWVSAVFAPTEHFEHDIEIITPPKLRCNPTRPKISKEIPQIAYDTNFKIATKDAKNIQKVSLIRMASTTHNNNMDQRHLFLPILNSTNSSLTLASPKDSSWAPPGYYLLFILNDEDVPSVGKFVKVG